MIFCGVWIHSIILRQKKYPYTVRITARLSDEAKAVVTARFTPLRSPAPNSLDTITDAPRFIPTANAIKITVIG